MQAGFDVNKECRERSASILARAEVEYDRLAACAQSRLFSCLVFVFWSRLIKPAAKPPPAQPSKDGGKGWGKDKKDWKGKGGGKAKGKSWGKSWDRPAYPKPDAWKKRAPAATEEPAAKAVKAGVGLLSLGAVPECLSVPIVVFQEQ